MRGERTAPHNDTMVETAKIAEPWVTTAEIARHLSKPKSWIFNNYVALGIPHRKIGNQLRFRISEVDQWIDQQLGAN